MWVSDKIPSSTNDKIGYMNSGDHSKPVTEDDARKLGDHELKMAYDITLKISNAHHEPQRDLVKLADEDNRVYKAELKRRNLFDNHRPQ